MAQHFDGDDTHVWNMHAKWWAAHFGGAQDAEYAQQILPKVQSYVRDGDDVLDIGCGEGQVCRAVRAAGASSVTGVDASEEMLASARASTPGSTTQHFLLADACALPFEDATFDMVTCVLVLEHVEEHVRAIAEMARVLRNDARCVVFLNHPLFQTPNSGWMNDHILNEEYWRVGAYLHEKYFLEHVDNEVALPFWHRPLSHYVNAMASNGLCMTEMYEPAALECMLDDTTISSVAAAIPRLLGICARKVEDE